MVKFCLHAVFYAVILSLGGYLITNYVTPPDIKSYSNN